jgi:hypothetical protein
MRRLLSRSERFVLALILAAYVGLALGYAFITPTWQNPDEPAHFNYVMHVVRTGTLPELRPGDWNSDLNFRVKTGEIPPEHPDVAGMRYEAWQPPLYYLLAGGVMRVFGSGDLRHDVLLLRGLGVLLGGLTLLAAYVAGKRVCCPALAVPAAIAGIPMFTATSASVSADPMANLLAATLFLLLLRALTRSEPLVLGAALGLGILTKLALVVFAPLALLVSLRRPRSALLVFALALLVLTPWLVHQVTTYGWSDPLGTVRHDQVVFDQLRFPGLTFEYARSWLTITYHSFWGQFGWMAIEVHERLYWAWGLFTLLGALGLMLGVLRRAVPLDPRLLITVLVVLGTAAAYVGYNLSFQQAQGRYLFPALVPLCVLLVQGWASWLPPRLRQLGPLLIGATLMAINAYTLTRVLAPAFAAT